MNRHLGRAWMAMGIALALHVTDEALNDFLSVYNPTVHAIRARLPFLPLPAFTFGPWLAGLIVAILLILALSRFAFRGARWMRPPSYFLGVLMLFNGLGHFAGSVYMGRPMPGVWSAPALLAASSYMLWAVRNRE